MGQAVRVRTARTIQISKHAPTNQVAEPASQIRNNNDDAAELRALRAAVPNAVMSRGQRKRKKVAQHQRMSKGSNLSVAQILKSLKNFSWSASYSEGVPKGYLDIELTDWRERPSFRR